MIKAYIKNLIINILADDERQTMSEPKYVPLNPKRVRRLVISEDEDGNFTYTRTDPDLPAPFSVSPRVGFGRQMETATLDLFTFLVSDDAKRTFDQAMHWAVQDWKKHYLKQE